MRKGDVLCWGINHIAQNHGFAASTENMEEDLSVCVYGGCNVPTYQDVVFLCEDLGIPRSHIDSSDFGIDVFVDWEWLQEGGMLQDEYVPTGMEMWKRYGFVIGS